MERSLQYRAAMSMWNCVIAGALLVTAACVDNESSASIPGRAAELDQSFEPDTWTPPPRHVWIAVRDRRDCAPPACGGWFVQRVDQSVAHYVVDLELGLTGLRPEVQAKVLTIAGEAPSADQVRVALRGITVDSAAAPGLASLRVSVAWVGPSLRPDDRHVGVWYGFDDDDPELIVREIGLPFQYAVDAFPPAPEGVSPVDTLAIGWRDEDLLDVDYRLVRVR